METKKDLVYVEIDSGVEDIKLYYIFEREVAEHLRRKQKHPLRILREASEDEARRLAEFYEWLDAEISRYYDKGEGKKRDKSKSKEYVLVEVKVGDIKQHYVLRRDFAEHLKKKTKSIRILRESSEKEQVQCAIVEAFLYHELFHYYD
mgnify:CR=1 FL=1